MAALSTDSRGATARAARSNTHHPEQIARFTTTLNTTMSTPPYSNGPDSPQGHPQTPQGYPQQPGYPQQQQGYPPPHGYPGGPPKKDNTALIIGGVVLLLALIGAGVFLMSGGSDEPSYAATTPAAAPAPATAADPALTDAATPPPAAASAPVAASAPATAPTVASGNRLYANSPGDGFLSLRSDPSVDSGRRVVRIPHGSPVNVSECERSASSLGGVSGRWCSATYDGRSGYVFDAYLASSQPGPRTAARSSGGGSVSPGPTESSESLYQVTGAALNFRSGPSINASRVGTLSRGDTFTTDRCEASERNENGKWRKWCHASANTGLSGWVSVSNDLISVLAG